MKTEWRVLQVEPNGGTELVMAYRHERWALAALKRAKPTEGAILTIEGQRDYVDGWRGFKRTGLVKGAPTTIAQKRWTVEDATFYLAGNEPKYTEVAR